MRLSAVLRIAALVVSSSLPLHATDAPDAEVNRVSGSIEAVDAMWKDSAWSIRYSVDPGPGQPGTIEMVTDSPDHDRSPRIAIDDGGNAGVVWFRDETVDRILFRLRDRSTKSWSPILQVSAEGESSRNPEIVRDETTYWIVFEFDREEGDTGIAVNGIADGAEPIPSRTLLDSTDYPGNTEVLAHAAFGEVWVTWVHSELDVGWSRYDPLSGSWSLPAYEPYDTDDAAAARARVRLLVLAP